MSRAADWLRQARRDLDHAYRSLAAGDHEWACFAAHQAAEKAVKALLMARGIDAWGHAVTFLLGLLPEGERVPAALQERVKELDRHYAGARYPDAYPAGAPFQFYNETTARSVVEIAAEVIALVEGRLSPS